MNNLIKSEAVTLPNGLSLFLVSAPGSKSVSIHSYVGVGSVHENAENNGISHFLEHMMFRGNTQLGNTFDLSRKFEYLGGQINASTSYFYTEYWLDYHVDFFEEGVKNFCTFLKNPELSDIQTERSIILEEILDDYGYSNQLIDADALTANMVWGNQPLGAPVIGTKNSICAITEEMLLQWYNRFYHPANMSIGISGDINIRKAVELVSIEFENIAPHKNKVSIPKSVVKLSEDRFCTVFHKDSQFNIQWSFQLDGMDKKRRLILGIIFRILNDGAGSRLQKTIREEKGLVYDIDIDYLLEESGCLLSINSTVSERKLPELIKSLVVLIESLRFEGITNEELELAKLKHRTGMDYCYDSPAGVLAEKMAKKLLPHYDTGKAVLNILKNITKEDVNDIICELFRKKESYFVCVGPGKQVLYSELREYLKDWL